MNAKLRKKIERIWQSHGGCVSFEPEVCDFCEKVEKTVNLIRNRENGMFVRGSLNTVLGQPLTEGEGECECQGVGDFCYTHHCSHSKCPRFDPFTGRCHKPQQESNKEEVTQIENKGTPHWSSGKVEEPSKKEKCMFCKGNHQSATCNAMKEPSKKEAVYLPSGDGSFSGEIAGYTRVQELSKKPSTRIEEIMDRNEMVDHAVGIIEYLDELHNQGKI